MSMPESSKGKSAGVLGRRRGGVRRGWRLPVY
jgi:hypothetical protein